MPNSFSDIDIQQVWKEMAKKKFKNKSLQKIEIMNAIKTESHSHIAELKKQLEKRTNRILYSCIVLGPIALIMSYAYYVNIWTPFSMMIPFVVAILLYRTLSKKINAFDQIKLEDKTILEQLKSNQSDIKSLFKTINQTVIYSFIILTLFWVIGYISAFGTDNLSNMMRMLPFFMLNLFIVIWSWGNYKKKNLDKHIEKLHNNIIRLETLS